MPQLNATVNVNQPSATCVPVTSLLNAQMNSYQLIAIGHAPLNALINSYRLVATCHVPAERLN